MLDSLVSQLGLEPRTPRTSSCW